MHVEGVGVRQHALMLAAHHRDARRLSIEIDMKRTGTPAHHLGQISDELRFSAEAQTVECLERIVIRYAKARGHRAGGGNKALASFNRALSCQRSAVADEPRDRG